MEKQRNADGQFTPEHTDEEILAAVRAHEPAATSEVAGGVGTTRQGADRRLRRLRDEGRVNSNKIGASLVPFAPERASPTLPAPAVDDDATDESEKQGTVGQVELDALTFDRDVTPQRREHLGAWFRHVRERGEGVTGSDFEAWWSDARERETGYGARSFWQAFAEPATNRSGQFDGPNSRTYRLIGEDSPGSSSGEIYDPTEEFHVMPDALPAVRSSTSGLRCPPRWRVRGGADSRRRRLSRL